MSKRSKLALLLAMLLGASTVIAACDGGGSSSSGDSSSSSSSSELSPSQEEEIANDLYKERIDKWLKYVEYNAPNAAAATKTALTQKDTNEVDTTFDLGAEKTYQTVETGAYKTKFTGEADNPDDPEGPKVPIEWTEVTGNYSKTKVYSQTTGSVIAEVKSETFVEVADAEKGGNVKRDSTKTKANDVLFEVSEFHANVLEIKKTAYALVEPEIDPEATEPFDMDAYKALVKNYEAVATYTYYDVTTGNVIAKDLEERAEQRETNVLDIGEKTYVMVEKGIAKVFDKGMEYDVPVFDETKAQYRGDEYAYFEQGEYGYRFEEEPANTVQISADFAMATFPGVAVQVYKDYDLVATYETDAFHVSGYAVLPNGNVYFCEYKQLAADATEYDISADNYKFDVVHTILNVETGATSEVANEFVASKVYTEATPNIQTLLNLNTLGQDNTLHTLKLKEGYVLAEITELGAGALQGNSTFAVLDSESMELVEKLPKIVDTQFGYASFINEDYMLVMMKMVDNQAVYYMANVETGDLELYPKTALTRGVVDMGNDCFKIGNSIYDLGFNWHEVADLSVYESVQSLGNGKLLVERLYTPDEYYYGNTYRRTWNILSVQEPSYSGNPCSVYFSGITEDTADDYYSFDVDVEFNGKLIIVKENGVIRSIYDANGNSLFASGVATKYVYEQDSMWKYVDYTVTTSVTCVELEEGVYVVTESERWSKYNENGYYGEERPSDDVMANDGKIYHTSYIVK